GESRSWPADAGIRPAGRAKLPWIVDVPQVDDRLRRHELRELAEVERPELVPLRRDHEDVGSAGAVVDVARVVELREDGPRVLRRGPTFRPRGGPRSPRARAILGCRPSRA